MDLSVIVVTRNASELLQRCLSALSQSVQNIQFEIWVVDNGSNDGSVEILQSCFPRVNLLRNKVNLGFARANNQAWPHCRGRYVLLLNNDAFVEKGCVEEMVAHLESYPRCAVAGAHLFFADGRPQWSHGPLPSLWSELWDLLGHDIPFGRQREGKEAVTTGMVSGACLMVRTDVLEALGGFDERFFFYAEEADLCCRARHAGWEVAYLPNARAIHLGGGNREMSRRRKLLLYDAKLLYFKKHFPAWQSRLLAGLMGVTSFLKVLLYGGLYLGSAGRVRQVGLWWHVFLSLCSGRREALN